MKHSLSVAILALALALGAPGAFAFDIVNDGTSIDNKAGLKLADPDDLTNEMSSQQSAAGRSGATIMHFGNTTLQFQAGSGSSANRDVGIESRFVPDPAANSVPSLRGH
jgi:hypothetical protein